MLTGAAYCLLCGCCSGWCRSRNRCWNALPRKVPQLPEDSLSEHVPTLHSRVYTPEASTSRHRFRRPKRGCPAREPRPDRSRPPAMQQPAEGRHQTVCLGNPARPRRQHARGGCSGRGRARPTQPERTGWRVPLGEQRRYLFADGGAHLACPGSCLRYTVMNGGSISVVDQAVSFALRREQQPVVEVESPAGRQCTGGRENCKERDGWRGRRVAAALVQRIVEQLVEGWRPCRYQRRVPATRQVVGGRAGGRVAVAPAGTRVRPGRSTSSVTGVSSSKLGDGAVISSFARRRRSKPARRQGAAELGRTDAGFGRGVGHSRELSAGVGPSGASTPGRHSRRDRDRDVKWSVHRWRGGLAAFVVDRGRRSPDRRGKVGLPAGLQCSCHQTVLRLDVAERPLRPRSTSYQTCCAANSAARYMRMCHSATSLTVPDLLGCDPPERHGGYHVANAYTATAWHYAVRGLGLEA